MRAEKGDIIMKVLLVEVLLLLMPFSLYPVKCIAGEVKIPSTTKVLDEETLKHLSISEDGSVLVFDMTTPILESLSYGDVIVGGVSEATPYGLSPRRVASIEKKGDRFIVETIPATIENAIEKGKIEKQRTLNPNAVEKTK